MKLSITLIVCLLVSGIANAADGILEGKVKITGKKEYKGKWLVKPGTEIILEADAVCGFSGEVRFNGTKGKPITVKGNNGGVMLFEKCPDVTIKHLKLINTGGMEFSESAVNISKSSFSKNKVALKVSRSSTAVLENIVSTDNEIGIVSELKAHCVINNSTVSKNNVGIAVSQLGVVEVKGGVAAENMNGIVIHQDGAGRITGVKISKNDVGVVFHRNEGSIISGGVFSKNKIGIYGEVYSNLNLSDSVFSDNETGIKLIQFCGGKIRGNSFEKNGAAVYLEKKSSPDVRHNTFKGNKTAVFCDFSSYPIITLNNFTDNDYHVKLGIYQSADFENSAGSYMIQMQEVVSKQSRKTTDFKAKRYVGEVFAKKNYWDEKTIAEMEKGDNVTAIYDGNDMDEVKYEGYGEDKYKVDKVVFRPYLKTPAGKEKK